MFLIHAWEKSGLMFAEQLVHEVFIYIQLDNYFDGNT